MVKVRFRLIDMGRVVKEQTAEYDNLDIATFDQYDEMDPIGEDSPNKGSLWVEMTVLPAT